MEIGEEEEEGRDENKHSLAFARPQHRGSGDRQSNQLIGSGKNSTMRCTLQGKGEVVFISSFSIYCF